MKTATFRIDTMRPTEKPSSPRSNVASTARGLPATPSSESGGPVIGVPHHALSGSELDLSLRFGRDEIESWDARTWAELDTPAGRIRSVLLPEGMRCIPDGLGALPGLAYLRIPNPQGTSFKLTGTGTRSSDATKRDITLEVIYAGTRCLQVELFEDDALTYTGRGPRQLQVTYFTDDGEFSDRFMEFVQLTSTAPVLSEEFTLRQVAQEQVVAETLVRVSRPTLSLQQAAAFIEMGQGIIVHGPASVVTSPLTSCSLICGINDESGHCGAFHYPAKALGDDPELVADMRNWLEDLRPTQIHIAMAPPAKNAMEAAFLQGIPEDQDCLVAWVEEAARLKPVTSYSTHPRMDCRDGTLAVAASSPFSGGLSHDLQELQAGGYEDRNGRAFDLFGTDRT